MSPSAVTFILEEHQSVRAVLRSFRMLIERSARQGRLPDFGALRAMLFYIDEVPRHSHHAKESLHLFPLVSERCPALRPVLRRLEDDHGRGEIAIKALERALLAYEVMGESRREAFEQAAQDFLTRYLGHMEVEENYVIPVALDYLTAADWQRLDTVFSPSSDPAERDLAESHRRLLRQVLFQEGTPSFCK